MNLKTIIHWDISFSFEQRCILRRPDFPEVEEGIMKIGSNIVWAPNNIRTKIKEQILHRIPDIDTCPRTENLAGNVGHLEEMGQVSDFTSGGLRLNSIPTNWQRNKRDTIEISRFCVARNINNPELLSVILDALNRSDMESGTSKVTLNGIANVLSLIRSSSRYSTNRLKLLFNIVDYCDINSTIADWNFLENMENIDSIKKAATMQKICPGVPLDQVVLLLENGVDIPQVVQKIDEQCMRMEQYKIDIEQQYENTNEENKKFPYLDRQIWATKSKEINRLELIKSIFCACTDKTDYSIEKVVLNHDGVIAVVEQLSNIFTFTPGQYRSDEIMSCAIKDLAYMKKYDTDIGYIMERFVNIASQESFDASFALSNLKDLCKYSDIVNVFDLCPTVASDLGHILHGLNKADISQEHFATIISFISQLLELNVQGESLDVVIMSISKMYAKNIDLQKIFTFFKTQKIDGENVKYVLSGIEDNFSFEECISFVPQLIASNVSGESLQASVQSIIKMNEQGVDIQHLLDILKACGIDFSKNINKFQGLEKLTNDKIPQAKAIFEKMNKELSTNFPEESFPVDFILATLEDDTVYDIAAESYPLFSIKYDNKYNIKGFYDKQLQWVVRISPAVRKEFLEYLKAGNINSDFSTIVSETHVSVKAILEQHDIPDGEEKTVEQAFAQETAQWRERKKLIDFIEISDYRLQNTDQLEILQRLSKRFDMDECAKLYITFCNHLRNDKDFSFENEIHSFEVFVNHFGLSQIPLTYQFTKQMLVGEIPEKIQSFVSSSGEKGILELKEYVQKSMHTLVNNEESINPNTCSELDFEIYRYLIRFDTSQWKQDGKNFNLMLHNLYTAKQRGELAPVSQEFHTETIKLRSIPKNLDLSKFKESYTATVAIIKNGLEASGFTEHKKGIITDLLDDINQKQAILRNGKRDKTSGEIKPLNEKEINAIQSQIEKGESTLIKIQQSQNNAEILTILANTKYSTPNLDIIIQNIVISDFLLKNPAWKAELEAITQTSEIELTNIEKIIEFLFVQVKDHAIGDVKDQERQEDWLYPDLTNEQRKFLKKLFSPRALNEIQAEVRKTQGEELADKFIFRPSRYIMGEMSGYSADACWTSQSEIIKNNHNMTPIICIKSPDLEPDILGAALIFENTIHNGQDKVLILRGVDPQDRLMQKAAADSFCEQMIAYAKAVAKKKGCKYVVANIDQGVISNRPGITSYFQFNFSNREQESGSVGDLEKSNMVKLDTTMDFNGYNITNSCQIISVIDE